MLLKTNSDENIATQMEKCLSEYDYTNLGKEEIKMRICYPKSEFTNQTEIYLFNQKVNKGINYVMTKKNEKPKAKVYISEVDENFLTIFEKIQMFNFRQIYTFDINRALFGDIEIKYGSMYKEVLEKIHFLEISSPYTHTFENSKNFIFDIVSNFFPFCEEKEIEESCMLSNNILAEYEFGKKTKHLELLQYVNYIFKKKI